jgi:hypothetical protein
MSLGGYISHRRVCCGVFWVVGVDFDLAAIPINNAKLKIQNEESNSGRIAACRPFWMLHFSF